MRGDGCWHKPAVNVICECLTSEECSVNSSPYATAVVTLLLRTQDARKGEVQRTDLAALGESFSLMQESEREAVESCQTRVSTTEEDTFLEPSALSIAARMQAVSSWRLPAADILRLDTAGYGTGFAASSVDGRVGDRNSSSHACRQPAKPDADQQESFLLEEVSRAFSARDPLADEAFIGPFKCHVSSARLILVIQRRTGLWHQETMAFAEKSIELSRQRCFSAECGAGAVSCLCFAELLVLPFPAQNQTGRTGESGALCMEPAVVSVLREPRVPEMRAWEVPGRTTRR